MAYVIWSKNLSVGIDVIDKQHMRIVNYINELEDAINMKGPTRQAKIVSVVSDAIDYTESHFNFEESLLEDVGYSFLKAHKKVHELFIRRMADYKRRLDAGEEIAVELRETLARWLVNHIKSEDADYAKWFKKPEESANVAAASAVQKVQESASLGMRLKRFFGGK